MSSSDEDEGLEAMDIREYEQIRKDLSGDGLTTTRAGLNPTSTVGLHIGSEEGEIGIESGEEDSDGESRSDGVESESEYEIACGIDFQRPIDQ